MTDLTAGTLKKLNRKELNILKDSLEDPKIKGLIDRVIKSKTKTRGFGVYINPSEAGKKGGKAKWQKGKIK